MSDDIHEFMLGYNWLADEGVHWFFDRRVLVFRGKEIPLHFWPSSRISVSWVLARERVVMAPWSECDQLEGEEQGSMWSIKRQALSLWMLGAKSAKLIWPEICFAAWLPNLEQKYCSSIALEAVGGVLAFTASY